MLGELREEGIRFDLVVLDESMGTDRQYDQHLNIPEAIEHVARLREEPVSADELERAQTYAIGVHAIQQQNGSSVLSDVIDAWLFGKLSDLETFEDSVRSVTARRMQQLAQRHFDPNRRVEGIIRGVSRAV